MNFKRLFYKIIVGAMVFAFVIIVAGGVVLPVNILYLLATIFGVAFAIQLHEPILKFLTIRVGFVSQMIMSSLLIIGILYLFNYLMPEFTIVGLPVNSQTLGVISIKGFILGEIETIICISLLTGLINTFLDYLKS
ncbi:MAG TPA: hypothetical protein PKJ86_02885 [Candidatus Dojkabacteria bacterium]|nr:hypothetical protein [Candidatus Dojkabacteria bacterium]